VSAPVALFQYILLTNTPYPAGHVSAKSGEHVCTPFYLKLDSHSHYGSPICRYGSPVCRYVSSVCRYVSSVCRYVSPVCHYVSPVYGCVSPTCYCGSSVCCYVSPTCRYVNSVYHCVRPTCRYVSPVYRCVSSICRCVSPVCHYVSPTCPNVVCNDKKLFSTLNETTITSVAPVYPETSKQNFHRIFTHGCLLHKDR
jgi:hypothetical protein